MDAPEIQEVENATGGRYRVERLLATGGMGAVYLAHHRELESRVAIKVLPPAVAKNPTLIARFKREAALAARLSHPNVVPVFEFTVGDELPFLIMPFIEGQSLAELLEEKKPLGFDQTMRMVGQIGAALSFAHGRDIVHRDIKPSNILLESGTNRWLLTDFGIAHVASQVDTALTNTGAAIGTPAYMAPEQFGAAEKVDQRSDLYSLAMTAAEAVSGVRPDPLSTLSELVAEFREANPSLSGDQARAFIAPLSHAPSQRPQTVADWLTSVEASRGSRKKRRVAAALVGTGVLVAGLVFFPRSSPPVSQPTVAVLPFDVQGSVEGVDLAAVPATAIEWSIQQLPGFRVVGSAALRDAEIRNFGNDVPTERERLESAADLGATHVLLGTAAQTRDDITIRIRVFDLALDAMIPFESTGPVDSLSELISDLVVRSFAAPLAAELEGVASPVLPHGIDAINAYLAGVADFHSANYRDAITHFDQVSELDSTYALAPFKRMLALTQWIRPTEVSDELRSSLDGAISHSTQLGPAYGKLLDGYKSLLLDGDIKGAERTFRDVVLENPGLTDAWFVLGFFQYRFGPLLGVSVHEARNTFQRVLSLEPDFAAAHAQLALMAIELNDQRGAQAAITNYLALDDTSVWASLARSVDSMLFRPTLAPAVLSSFSSRPAAFLETIALSGAQINPPGGARGIAEFAADEIWQRANSDQQTVTAFRIRMSYLLGGAQFETATREFTAAFPRLPQDEIDRWMVLSSITHLPSFGTPALVAAAASRLAATTDTVHPDELALNLWLHSRWESTTNASSEEASLSRLRVLDGSPARHPLTSGLIADLDARKALAAGDSAGALRHWTAGLQIYDADQIFVGLVASQWPARLDYAALALATGDPQTALTQTEPFMRLVNVIDQVAWAPAMKIRAAAALALGNRATAIDSYNKILRIVNQPDGDGILLKEEIQRALAELSQPN